MMYNKKLVAVVKVGGNVLRETNGTVYIPFGREYTIQLKNLHTQKAVVSIDIDGDDVTDNSQYVINSGQTIEIEGFLKGNNITRKFKFLEKTQEISDFRGDQMEDGLIKFTYQFEFEWPPSYWCTYNDGYRGITGQQDFNSSPKYGSSGSSIYSTQVGSSLGSCNLGDRGIPTASANIQQNDAGVTGRGSNSNQSFKNADVGFLDPKVHTMVIQLKGETKDNQYVQAPITTRSKLQCDMCGKRWPSRIEYCGGCGNSLR